MFKNLLGKKKTPEAAVPSVTFTPRMPMVDETAPVERVFDKARRAAAGGFDRLDGPRDQRNVVIVTPARKLILRPCPTPDLMPPEKARALASMLPSHVTRHIAAIGFTDINALEADIVRAIPFIGLLGGFVYIGHQVWVFEGHRLAIPCACRGADLLIVDDAMEPYLDPGWSTAAARAMLKPEIVLYEREKKMMRPLHG